jgi:hypothetical protein
MKIQSLAISRRETYLSEPGKLYGHVEITTGDTLDAAQMRIPLTQEQMLKVLEVIRYGTNKAVKGLANNSDEAFKDPSQGLLAAPSDLVDPDVIF